MAKTNLFVCLPCWVLIIIFSATNLTAQTKPAVKKLASEKREPEKTFSSDTTDWQLVRPTDADAEFKMPRKPRYIERSFTPVENQPAIKVHLHLTSFNNGQAATVFSYHDLHETPATPKIVEDTLAGAVVGTIANVLGKEISQQRIRYKEYPGRQFVYMYAQGDKLYKASARVFLVGNRQYQVSALMENEHYNEALAIAFLNSFRLLESDSDLPPKPPAREK